jgi:hypothetical protein
MLQDLKVQIAWVSSVSVHVWGLACWAGTVNEMVASPTGTVTVCPPRE